MTFRDQSEALRAQVEALRSEIDAAVASIETLRQAQHRLELAVGSRGGDASSESPRCPVCGSARSTPGRVHAQGMRFLAEDAGWLESTFSSATDLQARRCDDCKCTLLFDRE